MESLKVPKEVMEVLYEAAACRELAKVYNSGWLPSLKAMYYQAKAVKATSFAWRALHAAIPRTRAGSWEIDMIAATVVSTTPAATKVARPRKPKAASVVPEITTTKGEVK